MSALAERDAVISACEARAGAALVKLTDEEGLSLVQAVEWCGGADLLTAREAARLRHVAQPAAVGGPGREVRTTNADASSADGGAASNGRADATASGGADATGGEGLLAVVRLGEAGAAALAAGCVVPSERPPQPAA